MEIQNTKAGLSEIFVNPSMTVPEINMVIANTPSGTTVSFEKGEYHMRECFDVKSKRNLRLNLDGAVFRPYFNNENGEHVPTDSIDVFHFEDCENLEIYGGVIDSENAPNVRGVVTDVTDEYLEIRLFPETPLCGREKFVHGRTLDELSRPCVGYIHDRVETSKRFEGIKDDRIPFANGNLVCTNPPFCNMELELVEENLFRIRNIYKNNFKKGMKCTLGYVYYGNNAFLFTACRGVLMEGTVFKSFGGMGVVILPDSRDFTFRNVSMRSGKEDGCTEPVQADGIHVVGCGGRFVLDSCYWEYTIDDALNVHAQLLTVKESRDGRIDLIYDKRYGKVLKHWASDGDELRVYDVKTKQLKGTVRVLSAGSDSAYTNACEMGIEINVGDFITNPSHFCELEAVNCHLKNCTGGFKLRSVNSAHVHDCFFDGVKKTIILSVAFATTKEGGPVKDVLIEKNVFNGACYDNFIYSGVYSGDKGVFKHLHKNITIRENVFTNATAPNLIELTATDGVVVENNIVKNCKSTFFEFIDCNDVVCRKNITE